MTELAMLSLLQQSHSVLNPSSPQTRLIDRLWDAMYFVSAVVFVLVVLALLLSVFRRRDSEAAETDPGQERSLTTAVSIATALTVLILFGFLVYDVAVGRQLTRGLGKDALQVRVIGQHPGQDRHP